MADDFNICPESSAGFTISRADTITFKNQSAATHLPELMLNFRKQVEDALYFFEEFADIDPSIEENIDPLNTAAADLLLDIQEQLDVLLCRHFILTLPQNNQFTNPAMSFGPKFEPSNSHEAVVLFCQVINDVEEVLMSMFILLRYVEEVMSDVEEVMSDVSRTTDCDCIDKQCVAV